MQNNENNFFSDEYGFFYDPNQEKRFIDTNDASSYNFLPEEQRLFLRSHIYGGSHLREPRRVLVFDIQIKTLIFKEITTSKLQERVFLEILSNAVDNSFKSQRMGNHAKTLDILMDKENISIKSTGVPIPVDIHKYFYSKNQFGTVAELIFGVVGAGSNTDDSISKEGGGVNGVGAKLTNAFSRIFEVEIGNNICGFYQKVIWKKNMTEKISNVITPQYSITNQHDNKGLYHIFPTGERYTGENFVKITWKQDFRKFGSSSFSDEDIQLYIKYAIEASFIAKLIVTFNKMEFDCRSATKFLNFIPKSLNKNAIIHYELQQNINISGKELENAISNQQIIPIVELIILDTPGEKNLHISYCNGIYNVDGGSHTDEVYRELLKIIKDILTSSKGFDKGIDLSKLTIKDIKANCTIILHYKCNDPTFKGQDKEKLLKPTPKITFTPDEITKIKKMSLINTIYSIISGKNLKGINNGNSKKRIKDDATFRDCQWFGTKNQHESVMILCEGNSAGSYIRQWILATPERTLKYAYFLLRGKFKNVTDIGILEVMETNPEIKKLIDYMGFQFGVDYRTSEGISTLRYGYIFCMVDADSDGSHIQSLVMNFIYRYFPTFFLANRFLYVCTPAIRTFDKSGGQITGIFYNMFDYKTFVATGQKHHAKFFKGLASSKNTYAKEDARISPFILTHFDELAVQAFNIAFDKKMSSHRKQWINFWRDKIDTQVIHKLQCADPRMMYINISDYINTKLVEYSIDTFSRALPSYKDGLKKSQRQVLWYILMEWKFGHSKKGEVNIESIALGAKEKSKYHHGDLTDTLARTGSYYPGANNIPLITQEGQFGTREKLGKDIGASRYVETKPEEIIKLIFDEELMNLVPNNVVEDKEVEPFWIPAKIPLHVINGTIGIATAYSTEIPNHNPLDIIQWIINYITDQLVFPIIPWYRGFSGIIELEIFKGKYKKDSELVMKDQEMLNYYEGLTLVTKGIYQVLNEKEATYTKELPDGKKGEKVTGIVRDILINEIPIGVATSKYIFEMEKICDNVNDSQTINTDTPKIVLENYRGNVNEKDLKLVQKIGLCNISLIDDNSFPIQMRNIYEVLKLYCDNMKNLYQLLKTTRLKNLEIDIIKETKIIKLIDLLLNDKIITKRQKESYIEEQLLVYEIEFDVYKKLSRRSESHEGYEEHQKKLSNLQNKYKYIFDRHYLEDWIEDLKKLYDFIQKDISYLKLPHHVYPFIPTLLEDLISGKIKSPFIVKESLAQDELYEQKIVDEL